MECLKRAVELDPTFAAAWAGLAGLRTVLQATGAWPPRRGDAQGADRRRRAVALDPQSGEAHCALAMALLLWERDYAGAEAAFLRCLELNPDYTQGRCWYAAFDLVWLRGQTAKGIGEARRALEGDPLSAYLTALFAFILGVAGENAEALALGRTGCRSRSGCSPRATGATAWSRTSAASSPKPWRPFFSKANISDRAPFPLAYLVTTS